MPEVHYHNSKPESRISHAEEQSDTIDVNNHVHTHNATKQAIHSTAMAVQDTSYSPHAKFFELDLTQLLGTPCKGQY